MWEPARESGVTVNPCIDCATVFASRLAPTGFSGAPIFPAQPPWRGDLSPLGCAVAAKKGVAAQPSGDESPRHRSVIVAALGHIFLHTLRMRIKALGELALQVPRKRDDLGNRAVQLFRDAVSQFHPRQQFHQLGILINRHLAFPGDAQDFLGQGFVALGGEGRGVVAVVLEGKLAIELKAAFLLSNNTKVKGD